MIQLISEDPVCNVLQINNYNYYEFKKNILLLSFKEPLPCYVFNMIG